MSDEIRTHTDEDTTQFGGDCAITRTIPRIHPKLGIKMKGTRDSIEGADIQYQTFFRGDIWFKDNPHAEFNFTIWQKDNSSTAAIDESDRNWMHLTHVGFKPCKFDEWQVSEALQQVYGERDGLLVRSSGANSQRTDGVASYKVVMWRTGKRMDEENAKRNTIPTPSSINAEAQKRIGGVAAEIDPGVSALPSQITEVPHQFTGE